MINIKKLASNGLIFENPTLRLVLGTCPTLALTTSAFSSFGMGIAVTFVLICSNAIISMLKNIIPKTIRIPAFILIIATFVTIVKLVLDKFMPDLYEVLGVYLPLIVVNCIILGRAESFASKKPVLDSAFDGLFMGLGFTLSLVTMGTIRELLGNGSIFGLAIWDPNVFSIGFFSSSAGAFFTYAIMIALFNYIVTKVQEKKALRGAK
ncbi:MAG: electron transport complex subunit E [Clostridia bacterium]|nr:electron transport complex subunit E [Clostridia bacterium]